MERSRGDTIVGMKEAVGVIDRELMQLHARRQRNDERMRSEERQIAAIREDNEGIAARIEALDNAMIEMKTWMSAK